MALKGLEQGQDRRPGPFILARLLLGRVAYALRQGSEGLLKFGRAFRAAFPDLHWTIEDVITNDDKVVWRVVATGTHQAELMGIPATGKSIKVGAIIISRFENDLWREDWVSWDQLGMLQQLGVIPVP